MTEILGSENSGMFGVVYVDMVRSTYNMANLRESEYAPYYKVFYEAISAIARKFEGRVLKYIGDALLIYFPTTSDPSDGAAFKQVLDCGMDMIGIRCGINEALHVKKLQPISFRISADYGKMEYIETDDLHSADWIGPSMNMVAKINRIARTNSMVVGGDLHQILTRHSFKEYDYNLAGELDIGMKQKYPVYSVLGTRKIISDVGIHVTQSFRHSESPAAGSCYKIVIVDDEEDVLLAFREYLSGPQFEVDTFSDPMQLLGRIAAVGPTYYDLAILDMRMPTMNGLRIYQLLDALRPGIKVLFVTAIADVEDVLCLLRGFDKADILKKPVGRDRLISAIKEKIKVYA